MFHYLVLSNKARELDGMDDADAVFYPFSIKEDRGRVIGESGGKRRPQRPNSLFPFS